jgi:NADP-dependent 3-hydroxy acid dehydrogenase YdfG
MATSETMVDRYLPQMASDGALTLQGKKIVITGGTTGIGRATALLLASRGGQVLIFGRHEQELTDTMNDCQEAGLEDNVHGIIADSARKDDIEKVFREAETVLGGIDILINNAALAYQSIMKGGYDDWKYVVETNLLGYMACAHEAVKRMKETGHGHIVNIGSMSADVREEDSSVYVATKSGIQGFSEALRKEVNKLGIKVTLIEPGAVGTDMQPVSVEEQRQKQEELTMLKAEDIAECIYYALVQPERCDVVSIQIRPHLQTI